MWNQGFLVAKLKSQVRTFSDCHHDLVNRYGISCHIWPQICSVCLNHNSVLSSLMTYHQVCNKKNSMGTTSGAGPSYPDHMRLPPILHRFVLLNL